MSAVILTLESPFHEDVGRLLALADARAASVYPAESRHGLSAAALLEADVQLFVAWADGEAVACGGYAMQASTVPVWAEVKRLFVRETARKQGIARALMTEIERSARGDGAAVMRLETGVKSDEAIGLYRSLGFVARGPFGMYALDPLSVFMEKQIG